MTEKLTWRDKRVSISLGTIAAVAVFAFTYREDIPETFHDVTGHATAAEVELIASSLEQTQKSLSSVIIDSTLTRLREELHGLNKSIEEHGDDGYNVKRREEVIAEIKFWEQKRACNRDSKLCNPSPQ